MSKIKNPPVCSISFGANIIKQVVSLIYQGTVITHDGKCDKEIKRRIALAKTTFSNLSKVFKNKRLSLHIKRRLLKCYVRPVLLYGSECWTITDAMKKKLEAAEMWFYRKILRIPYTAHVKNEVVLERMSENRELISIIRSQQMKFFGHIMRNKEIKQS